MTEWLSRPCTAFAGTRKIAKGALVDVALAVRSLGASLNDAAILVIDDASGAVLDLDLRGSTADVIDRLTTHEVRDAAAPAKRTRGRPKLGVVAREVTLLPRHWDWLAAQPGGASQALRRLVDQARRADDGTTARRLAHERTYRFMAAMTGDLPGFEEATRALFSGDLAALARTIKPWPQDVQDYTLELAQHEKEA